jgi:hypothetical protein
MQLIIYIFELNYRRTKEQISLAFFFFFFLKKRKKYSTGLMNFFAFVGKIAKWDCNLPNLQLAHCGIKMNIEIPKVCQKNNLLRTIKLCHRSPPMRLTHLR